MPLHRLLGRAIFALLPGLSLSALHSHLSRLLSSSIFTSLGTLAFSFTRCICPCQWNANEENREQEADNEVDDKEEGGEEEEEEEEGGEGEEEEEDGGEDEEAEVAMSKWEAEDHEDDDVDTKKQKTDESNWTARKEVVENRPP